MGGAKSRKISELAVTQSPGAVMPIWRVGLHEPPGGVISASLPRFVWNPGNTS